jgi:hypothetical protein
VKLDRISNQIDQHLPQPASITGQHLRRLRRHTADQLDLLFMSRHRKGLESFIKASPQTEPRRRQLQFASFDLRKVQNVIDYIQQ